MLFLLAKRKVWTPTAVDVRSEGAIGNGVNDDATALQDAMDKASSTGVDAIVLQRNGVYRIGSGLTVPSNLYLIGNGATIQCDDGATFTMLTLTGVSNVTIEDVIIKEDSADFITSGQAIRINASCSKITLRRVHAERKAYGCYIDGVAPGTEVTDVTIDWCTFQHHDTHGFYCQYVNRLRIINSTSRENYFDGWKIGRATHDWEIEKCYSIDNGQAWILDATPGTNGNGIDMIEGGTRFKISNFTADGNAGTGINVKVNNNVSAANGNYCGEGVIENCHLLNSVATNAGGTVGLDFFSGQAGSALPHHISLTNVICKGNSHAGFRVQTGHRITFTACHSIENQRDGYIVSAGTDDVGDIEFHGCIASANGQELAGSSSGFGIAAGSTPVKIFGGISDGQHDPYATATPVTGGTTYHRHAVDISSSSDVLVNGLTVRNSTSGLISWTTGTNVVVRDCPGYTTEANGTGTLADATSSIAVAHGLAKAPALNDIQITPLADFGSDIRWWVSAVTSTTFTLTTSSAVTGNKDFAWYAQIR